MSIEQKTAELESNIAYLCSKFQEENGELIKEIYISKLFIDPQMLALGKNEPEDGLRHIKVELFQMRKTFSAPIAPRNFRDSA